MKSAIHRARFQLRGLAYQYPSLHIPYTRWRTRRRSNAWVVARDTEIVIEGYPKSANSFAWAAFTLAQDRPVRIAHHIHAPGQVLFGIKYGLPVVMLIREPDDAISSLKLRRESLDLSQLFRHYVRFYECLLPQRDHVVIAEFRTVTTDFGKIVRDLNDRFGTEFEPFIHSKQNVQACFQLIDSFWGETDQRLRGSGRPGLGGPGGRRPSGDPEKSSRSIRNAIEDPRLEALRSQAKALYRSFVAG